MPPRKVNRKIPDPIDQNEVDERPTYTFSPTPTVPELDGFKVGTHYWFSYRDNENCYGKLATIFPGTETIPPSVSIYEEMVWQHYVNVPITSLRTCQVGTRIKRRRVLGSKPKKKPIRR